MKPLKRKAQKRLSKKMQKLVKKYGEETVTSLVNTAVLAATTKSAHNGVKNTNGPSPNKKTKKHKPSMVSV